MCSVQSRRYSPVWNLRCCLSSRRISYLFCLYLFYTIIHLNSRIGIVWFWLKLWEQVTCNVRFYSDIGKLFSPIKTPSSAKNVCFYTSWIFSWSNMFWSGSSVQTDYLDALMIIAKQMNYFTLFIWTKIPPLHCWTWNICKDTKKETKTILEYTIVIETSRMIRLEDVKQTPKNQLLQSGNHFKIVQCCDLLCIS